MDNVFRFDRRRLIEKSECTKFKKTIGRILPGFQLEMWDDPFGSLRYKIVGSLGDKEIFSQDYIGIKDRNSCKEEVYKEKFVACIYRLVGMIYDYAGEKKTGEDNVKQIR